MEDYACRHTQLLRQHTSIHIKRDCDRARRHASDIIVTLDRFKRLQSAVVCSLAVLKGWCALDRGRKSCLMHLILALLLNECDLYKLSVLRVNKSVLFKSCTRHRGKWDWIDAARDSCIAALSLCHGLYKNCLCLSVVNRKKNDLIYDWFCCTSIIAGI